MKTFGMVLASALIFSTLGCDINQRLDRLEKDNQDLKGQIQRDQTVRNYDLQAKCSKDARSWFNENWQRDTDTIYLDFTNHYDGKLNKCFILVEYHFNSHLASPRGESWSNLMDLTDVYENAKYAHFAENHYTYWKPKMSTEDEVITCDMLGEKCKTIEEFNNLVRPYMND